MEGQLDSVTWQKILLVVDVKARIENQQHVIQNSKYY